MSIASCCQGHDRTRRPAGGVQGRNDKGLENDIRRFDAGGVTTKALVRVRRSGERIFLKGSGWRKAPERRDRHRDHCVNQWSRSSIAAQFNSRTPIVHPARGVSCAKQAIRGPLAGPGLSAWQHLWNRQKKAVIGKDHGFRDQSSGTSCPVSAAVTDPSRARIRPRSEA